MILDGMGTVHQLPRRHEVGEVAFHAAIVLGIGDDDTIAVVSDAEHTNLPAARVWAEHQLPRAAFPEWVTRRRHGVAGAFLHGQIERGYYTGPGDDEWEPDPDAPLWDLDLIDGAPRWRKWH